MKEVRNLDGKLVCSINHAARCIEIIRKECVTRIFLDVNGNIRVKQGRVSKTHLSSTY
jgi:exosome complex RNA-binding protein Rrp4